VKSTSGPGSTRSFDASKAGSPQNPTASGGVSPWQDPKAVGGKAVVNGSATGTSTAPGSSSTGSSGSKNAAVGTKAAGLPLTLAAVAVSIVRTKAAGLQLTLAAVAVAIAGLVL
jgi:hypothetical protein